MWNIARRDVPIPSNAPNELLLNKHVEFILKCGRDKESYVRSRPIYLIFKFLGIYNVGVSSNEWHVLVSSCFGPYG